MPRVRKFDPEPERMLKLPPLNPPRETSYGEVESELEICASRGRLLRAELQAVERDAVLVRAESEDGEAIGRSVESGDEQYAGKRRGHRRDVAL